MPMKQDFAPDGKPSSNAENRASVEEINRKLRAMQAMPDGKEKDAAAQELLDWILEH